METNVRERTLLIKFYLQVKNHRVVKENKQGDVRVHDYEKKVHVKLMIMKKSHKEKRFFFIRRDGCIIHRSHTDCYSLIEEHFAI